MASPYSTLRKMYNPSENLDQSAIQHQFEQEIRRHAKDGIEDLLQDLPLEELQEICSKDADQALLWECLEDNHFHENFQWIDIYYSQTANRGDSGDVCEVMRELLDNEGLDHAYRESSWFEESEGVRRANNFINLAYTALYNNYMEFPTQEDMRRIVAKKVSTALALNQIS